MARGSRAGGNLEVRKGVDGVGTRVVVVVGGYGAGGWIVSRVEKRRWIAKPWKESKSQVSSSQS